MAVVKVRDSMHSDELRLYTIGEDGVRIGETMAMHEGLLGGQPTRKPGTAGAWPEPGPQGKPISRNGGPP
jgi:circadian clock protein KaiC